VQLTQPITFFHQSHSWPFEVLLLLRENAFFSHLTSRSDHGIKATMSSYDWENDPWSWSIPMDLDHYLWRQSKDVRGPRLISADHFGPAIRLLTLEPDQPENPISCILKVADTSFINRKQNRAPFSVRADFTFKIKQNYEALSYTWGAQDSVPLRCYYMTKLVPSWISVTKNCIEALRQLRDPVQPRILWVDAICINQDDDEEKNYQVKFMDWIYQGATRVVVVLSDTSGPNGSTSSVFNVEDTMPSMKIFDHSYFTRIWVCQEVFFGRNILVYYAGHQFSWSQLAAIFRQARKSNCALEGSSAEFMIEMGGESRRFKNRKLIRKLFPQHSLQLLLQRTTSFQATDDRDKIIALLNMAVDVSDPIRLLLVDYSSSLEVLKLRLAAVRCFDSLNFLPTISKYGVPLLRQVPANFMNLNYDAIRQRLDACNFDLPGPNQASELASKEAMAYCQAINSYRHNTEFQTHEKWKEQNQVLYCAHGITSSKLLQLIDNSKASVQSISVLRNVSWMQTACLHFSPHKFHF
jgi:hypothetical protein